MTPNIQTYNRWVEWRCVIWQITRHTKYHILEIHVWSDSFQLLSKRCRWPLSSSSLSLSFCNLVIILIICTLIVTRTHKSHNYILFVVTLNLLTYQYPCCRFPKQSCLSHIVLFLTWKIERDRSFSPFKGEPVSHNFVNLF